MSGRETGSALPAFDQLPRQAQSCQWAGTTREEEAEQHQRRYHDRWMVEPGPARVTGPSGLSDVYFSERLHHANFKTVLFLRMAGFVRKFAAGAGRPT